MSAAPFLLSGEPLRRLLNRIIARQEASELRAWKHRHAGARRFTRTMSVVITLACVGWFIAALLAAFSTFDL